MDGLVTNGRSTADVAREDTIRQVREDMNRLRGRLFMAFEAMNLTEKHEKAAKGMVRHLTYDSQRELEQTLRTSDYDFASAQHEVKSTLRLEN